jgi:hypothetical protein
MSLLWAGGRVLFFFSFGAYVSDRSFCFSEVTKLVFIEGYIYTVSAELVAIHTYLYIYIPRSTDSM